MQKVLEQDRKSEKTKTTKKIVPAGMFSRCVAAIVDLAIVAFVAGLFYIGGQTIMQKTSIVVDNVDLMRKYNLDSGLLHYKVVDGVQTEEVVPETESTNYKDYEDIMVNYFTVYKTSECPEQYRDSKYTMYWYNVHIVGLEQDPNATPYDDLDSRPSIVGRGKNIFAYDESATDKYNARPVLKAGIDNPETAALKYYFIPEAQNTNGDYYIYSYALTDLMSTPYFNDAYATMYLWFYTIPILTSAFLSTLIFYFLVPLFTKNGQTLGKMVFHLGLVNKLGYQYKKIQLIPRFFFNLLLLVAAFIFANIFPYGLFIFLAVATIYFLVSYCVSVFTIEHKAIHDFFAATIVIDMKQSTWFKDANEESATQKRIDEYIHLKSDDKDDSEETNHEKNPNLLYVNRNFKNSEKGDSDEEPNHKS